MLTSRNDNIFLYFNLQHICIQKIKIMVILVYVYILFS